MIRDVPADPTPAVAIGQGQYATAYLVSEDRLPAHWWAKAIRWLADLILKKGL